jgi:cyclopropane-fatty-acyl-phospholipid synthase
MWDLYLVICEMGFRHENLAVFQIQLAKSLDTIPLTRDYMFDWERSQLDKDFAEGVGTDNIITPASIKP